MLTEAPMKHPQPTELSEAVQARHMGLVHRLDRSFDSCGELVPWYFRHPCICARLRFYVWPIALGSVLLGRLVSCCETQRFRRHLEVFGSRGILRLPWPL